MNKKITTIIITCLISLIFTLNVFALTDDESTQRKRAYYAGIDSTISLLSDKLGNLSNATIERIVVTSLQDFTSEQSVKENVQSEAGRLTRYTVEVTIQFSAQDGNNVQSYIFDHYLPAGTACNLTPASKSNLTTINYNLTIPYLSDYGYLVGTGIAYVPTFTGNFYHLDIDLNDYTSNGYSLTLPYDKKENPSFQEAQSSAVSTASVDVTAAEDSSAETPAVASESTSPSQQASSTASSSPKSESISSSSASKSSSSVKSAPSSAYKKVGLMVWIPTNGGKRYHSNSSCSGMINPRRVDLGEARYLGFTACGRCYR